MQVGNRAWTGRIGVGLLAAMAIAAVLALGSSRPASACSCVGAEVSWFIENADVGFIGVYQGSRENPAPKRDGRDQQLATFTVSEWFHGDADTHLDGDTVEVAAPANGGSCGFELRPGQEAAIFADRRGDGLGGSLCSTLDAGVVRAYLTEGGLPGGEAVLAVPGRFDRGGLALLDRDGQLIGYDDRFSFTWVPQVVGCPGGSTALFIDDGRALVVDLRDLSIRREVALGDLLQEASLTSVACRDQRGDRIDVVVERWLGDRSGYDLRSLDRIDEPGPDLDLPRSARPTLAGDRVVVQTYLDPGERLVVVDPDGSVRTVGELLRTTEDDHRGYVAVAASPDPVEGDGAVRVAVLEGEYRDVGVTSRLWLLDPGTGEELVDRTIEAETWQVSWLDADRLLLVVGGEQAGRAEIVDADTLEPMATVGGWGDGDAVLVDDTLWGSGRGPILAGDLGGASREVTALPTTNAGALVALAEPITVEASGADRPPVTVITPSTSSTNSTSTSTSNAPSDSSTTADDGSDEEAVGPGQPETPSGGLPLVPGAVGAAGLAAAAGFVLVRRRRRRWPPAPADDGSLRP